MSKMIFKPTQVFSLVFRYDFKKYILSLSKKEYAPAFLIKKNGDIHKFYDESYYSNVTNIEKINKTAIFIGIENAGKLINVNNEFINWCNDVVEKNDVEEIKINKESIYYDKYTKYQLQSIGHLIIHLGNKYNLNLKIYDFLYSFFSGFKPFLFCIFDIISVISFV